MSRLFQGNALSIALGEPAEIEKRLVKVNVPFPMYLEWDVKTKVDTIRAHPICAEDFQSALNQISGFFSEREIIEIGMNKFAGGFTIRYMRGGQRLSAHAYGIAFDFNSQKNGLNTPFFKSDFCSDRGKFVIDIFHKNGFVNYGAIFGIDSMHFEYTRIF